MKILFLAPHPFYQERGTPMAVDMLLKALSRRGDKVDVITYHEGEERSYPGVTLHRIPALPGARGIGPGFSLKKLYCDLFLTVKAFKMAARGHYQVIHAVEESVFMAMLMRRIWRVPYIFDMDSSMPRQIIEKFPFLAFALKPLAWFEKLAVRNALAVVPVCDALADIARDFCPRKLFILRDVSFLTPPRKPGADLEALRHSLSHPCLLYLGNLETYQGVDLLLESFAKLLRDGIEATLVIAGGKPTDIQYYREQADRLQIGQKALFLGPWPVERMAELFAIADILVSPRTRGVNTPMKIYPYLQSGKPILATDLPTHTQALSAETAMLAQPKPEPFAAAMRALIENPGHGRALAERAQAVAREKYSPDVFEHTVQEIYNWVENAAEFL